VGDVFVKFRHEERDVASAFRSAMIASLRKRPDLGLGTIVLVVGLAVAMRLTSGSMRVILAAMVAAVVLLVASSFVIVPKMMFRRGPLRVPMGVDASDEGLTIIAGMSARTLAWDDIVRVEPGARVIIVHHGEEALIVPRRAFRNRDRERAFVEMLARHASRDMRRLESGKSTPSANA
jgi:antitoxin (DNA-binding transcriptional repressor) of toxin-antitoxin stability system